MKKRFWLAEKAGLRFNGSMSTFRSCVVVLACALFWVEAAAPAQEVSENTSAGIMTGLAMEAPKVQTEAQASVASYEPGQSFYLAVSSDIEKPWHAYYSNPGTVGMPMAASLQAPEGFQVDWVRWSPPIVEKSSVGVAYAYESPVVVWKITPSEAAPEHAAFSIDMTWQLCREGQCNMPENRTLDLRLSRGDGTANSAWKNQQNAVIAPEWMQGNVSARSEGGNIVLSWELGEGAPELKEGQAYFFSDGNVVLPTAPQTLRSLGGGAYELILQPNTNAESLYPVADPARPLDALKGMLVLDGHGRMIDAPLAATAAASDTAETSPDFFYVLGMLFLGGLILNLMPCVFPVIGLKILGFVQLGGGERRKVFAHSASFVTGILISFWALTALLVYLSAISPEEGRSWAGWMQNDWVVYLLMLLMIVMGMSMYGIFEIGVGATGAGSTLQHKKGMAGSFFSGLLATVVATPCSAPFLGPVMAFAMQLPPGRLFVAMTCMALGLSFPYIVLGAFPKLVQFLPKPGAWMESLKQALAFILFAAAAWLLAVYLSFIPEDMGFDVAWILISLVVFAAAWWVYGHWCPMYRNRSTRLVGLIVALGLAAVGVWGSLPRSAPSLVWETWSENAVQEALDEGRPVFVDFTAKWCMTCLSNKKVAYSPEVERLLKKNDVLLLRADKTQPNPAIDEAMRRLDRSSIPVNVLYMPHEQPAITAELLTPGYLYDFLEQRLKGNN